MAVVEQKLQGKVHLNLTSEQLFAEALARGEGVLAANGALNVETGRRTGRSPADRFIVKDSSNETTIAWGNINQPFDALAFNALWERSLQELQSLEHFVSDLHVGADPNFYLPLKVITQTAWHNLFAQILFIQPSLYNPAHKPVWTILNVPHLPTVPERDHTKSDGTVIINFQDRKVLLRGMRYAGEMKKAMFSVLNYLLPAQDVLPMHCAANVGADGQSALFFGLSGTGKTTLSADPQRFLVGDDEHGWSTSGIFNFEGGCYAKCIDLSQEREPLIWNAIRHGAITENVVLDPKTLVPNYKDGRLTQNSRAAYPLTHIEKRASTNTANHPTCVLFLTCDLYGVLPPVARLSPDQAAYYFLSGYTALVGSTEVGQTEAIKTTFSTCFGAPFFPRSATVYAELLQKRLLETKAQVFLVNTGWTGGPYGEGGERFAIPTTRAIVSAIVTTQLRDCTYTTLPGFNLAMPTTLPGVDSQLLDPRKTWQNPERYTAYAQKLIAEFQKNFQKFGAAAAPIAAFGPRLL